MTQLYFRDTRAVGEMWKSQNPNACVSKHQSLHIISCKLLEITTYILCLRLPWICLFICFLDKRARSTKGKMWERRIPEYYLSWRMRQRVFEAPQMQECFLWYTTLGERKVVSLKVLPRVWKLNQQWQISKRKAHRFIEHKFYMTQEPS